MGIKKPIEEIQLNEIDLESYLYHLVKTNRKKAYFFVCTVNGDGTGWEQKSFHKTEMDKALTYIKKNKNKRIFVPTVLFNTRERIEEQIGQIRKILIDLDIYKIAKFKGVSPEDVFEDIKKRFFDTGKIPTSNAVTFSGGGLYLEWDLKYTPGGNVLSKRRVVAKIIFELLKEYGPDAKSLDAVHVFGLAQTINWKYGKDAVVRTLVNDVPTYTLAALSRSLPSLWDVWKKEKKIETEKEKIYDKNKVVSIVPIHKERTLAHDHIVSIKQLIALRSGHMEYYREKTLFFVRNAYHKMHSKRFYDGDTTLFQESYKLACEINQLFKEPLTDAEIRKNTLNTKKLYRFKTETINEWFEISLDEQIQMKVKTPEAKREKSKRQMRELRQKRGSMTKEEYNQERAESKAHLLDMLRRLLEKNPKAKRKELAELLGVTPQRISQLKKEI